MDRVEKQYAVLAAMADDYRKLLMKEFEKDHSSYLNMRRVEDLKRRTDVIRSRRGVTEDEIEIVELEKQIRRLCAKLNEPLPLPLQVLDEYVENYNGLRLKEITSRKGMDESIRSAMKEMYSESCYLIGSLAKDNHKHLIKEMLAKLGEK